MEPSMFSEVQSFCLQKDTLIFGAEVKTSMCQNFLKPIFVRHGPEANDKQAIFRLLIEETSVDVTVSSRDKRQNEHETTIDKNTKEHISPRLQKQLRSVLSDIDANIQNVELNLDTEIKHVESDLNYEPHFDAPMNRDTHVVAFRTPVKETSIDNLADSGLVSDDRANLSSHDIRQHTSQAARPHLVPNVSHPVFDHSRSNPQQFSRAPPMGSWSIYQPKLPYNCHPRNAVYTGQTRQYLYPNYQPSDYFIPRSQDHGAWFNHLAYGYHRPSHMFQPNLPPNTVLFYRPSESPVFYNTPGGQYADVGMADITRKRRASVEGFHNQSVYSLPPHSMRDSNNTLAAGNAIRLQSAIRETALDPQVDYDDDVDLKPLSRSKSENAIGSSRGHTDDALLRGTKANHSYQGQGHKPRVVSEGASVARPPLHETMSSGAGRSKAVYRDQNC